MRLLFATSLLPESEAFSGYEIANRCILQGLRDLGHDVTAIGFAGAGRSAHVAPGSINLGEVSLVTHEADTRRKLGWLARAVSNGTTFAAAKLQVIDVRDLQKRIDEAGRFDAVILNGVTMAAAFEQFLTRWPHLYVAHNVEWQSAAEAAAAAKGFVERTLFERESRLLKRIEARLCARSAFVHTLASEDLESLGLQATGRANVLPLTVHEQAVAPRSRTPKWDAGIIGTWSWAPNRIGLEWFLSEVVPLLPAGFSIAVAGRLPAGFQIAHANVTALGRVPDAAEFVRSARVLPLFSRAGTGIQLKTLEAFELGLPTVATSSSIRGIDVTPANCVVADEPSAFAAALLEAARSAPDADGRGFHATRRAALLDALAQGVAALDRARKAPTLQARAS
jgi:hypothetical protein